MFTVKNIFLNLAFLINMPFIIKTMFKKLLSYSYKMKEFKVFSIYDNGVNLRIPIRFKNILNRRKLLNAYDGIGNNITTKLEGFCKISDDFYGCKLTPSHFDLSTIIIHSTDLKNNKEIKIFNEHDVLSL